MSSSISLTTSASGVRNSTHDFGSGRSSERVAPPAKRMSTCRASSVSSEGHQFCTLGVGHNIRVSSGGLLVRFLCVGHRAQLFVPVCLQCVGHETIVRIDLEEAALCQI